MISPNSLIKAPDFNIGTVHAGDEECTTNTSPEAVKNLVSMEFKTS